MKSSFMGLDSNREVKMETGRLKKKAIIFVLIAVCGTFVWVTDSAEGTITDIEINPEEPTMEDTITIVTYGIELSGPVAVTDSVFNITETDIALDIYLDLGVLAVVTPWTYSEDIGILTAGTYDLTVRTIVDFDVTDSYFTIFQVVPEPGTALLIVFGVVFIRHKKRKNHINLNKLRRAGFAPTFAEASEDKQGSLY